MRGNTRSERAARRRFAILVMLHGHSHSSQEIISGLEQKQLFDCDQPAESAAAARQQRYQLRHDLTALRRMGCRIEFERTSGCYSWRNSPFGLTLNKAQLSTFALLFDTFEEATILHAAEIQDLLAYFTGLLSQDQQKQLNTLRRAFS